ncbi:tol-pal system protein YbgF [Vibrio sonorensis]|uniref:tol-pal system protein YbgF n=1 Tax=Vibrio sonorensis TaxID=1004316 RepID=UPI0008D9B898|nr:tol-pal system protein YbgF [Vibrio sonorensis]
MLSNLKRAVTLMLLASAASPALAAPAPVSDLNGTSNSAVAPANETDIQRLERLLQNRNRVQIQMQQQIDDMAQEISELRGQLEKNSYDMNQLVQRQRELFIELDKLRTNVSTAVVPAPVEAEPEDNTGTYSSNPNEQQAYQDAVDLILKKRDYPTAITAMKQFQKDFPDSTFTPNSHYWLGQLYFAAKQDKESVKSFATVVSYQDSNKRSEALLRLGDIAQRNNNSQAAKKYYQQVVDEYPGTSLAGRAQDALSKL